MQRLTTVIFLLSLANIVVAGQSIHKNVRLHVHTMPENLDSAIRSEILSQKVPVRIVAAAADAELIMKETSGFTSTERHKEGIRLIIEIFDYAGLKQWPESPGARFFWVDKASRDWQNKIAKNVAKKLTRSIQRYPSTASTTDAWWPFTRERVEKRAESAGADTGPDPATDASEESPSASRTSTYRTPSSEIDIDWSQKDTTQVDVRFNEPPLEATKPPVEVTKEPLEVTKEPLEIKSGMTEEEVRNLFGHPLKIARLEDKTIYRYKDMVVEFRGGKVSEVQFR